jgi:hypothetical protein
LVAPAAEVLRGRAAIERFWRTGVETGIESVTLARLDLQLQGDVAFEVLRILETYGCHYDNKIPRSAHQAPAAPAKAHNRPVAELLRRKYES